MPSFRVCSKSQVKSTVRQLDATHLLTLLDPQDSIYKPNRILPENWLWLRMEDEETPSHPNAPTKEQAARILEWGKALPDDACVVVHCYAGVSRSTASGLALWLQSNGTEHVAEAEAWLVSHRPRAVPNPLLAQHFDTLLNMNGAFVALCERISEQSMRVWFG